MSDEDFDHPRVNVVEEFGDDILASFDESEWRYWHGVEDGEREIQTVEFDPVSGTFFSDTMEHRYGTQDESILRDDPRTTSLSTTLMPDVSSAGRIRSWFTNGAKNYMVGSLEQIMNREEVGSMEISRAYDQLRDEMELPDNFNPDGHVGLDRTPHYEPLSGGEAYPVGMFEVPLNFEPNNLKNNLNQLYTLSSKISRRAEEISDGNRY